MQVQVNINNMTLEETMEFAETLFNTDPSGKQVIFDISNWKTFKPFSMLFIGAIIRAYRNSYREIPFRFNRFEGKCYSYAGTMGFFKYINEHIEIGKLPGEAKGSKNYIPITSIDFDELFENELIDGKKENMIEDEAKKLACIIDRGNKELNKVLIYLIREIIRNTFEHADTSKVWICGQYWPSKNLAEIAILDEGKGIFESLISNVSHQVYIEDNRSALQYAVKPGISESFGPSQKKKSYDVWENSGYGLYVASELCKELNGSFCIASSEDYMIVNNKGVSFGKTTFHGTAISIQVSTNLISNANKIIEDISSKGEEEAKNIRNSFKKASVPSKGLMGD